MPCPLAKKNGGNLIKRNTTTILGDFQLAPSSSLPVFNEPTRRTSREKDTLMTLADNELLWKFKWNPLIVKHLPVEPVVGDIDL